MTKEAERIIGYGSCKMKILIAAIIMVAMALSGVGAYAWHILHLRSVADDEFRVALVDLGGVAKVQTETPTGLPLALQFRFPSEHVNAAVGFPDRTDVYTLDGFQGTVRCTAHVRSNRVCYVTFGGTGDPARFRASIRYHFPRLAID